MSERFKVGTCRTDDRCPVADRYDTESGLVVVTQANEYLMAIAANERLTEYVEHIHPQTRNRDREGALAQGAARLIHMFEPVSAIVARMEGDNIRLVGIGEGVQALYVPVVRAAEEVKTRLNRQIVRPDSSSTREVLVKRDAHEPGVLVVNTKGMTDLHAITTEEAVSRVSGLWREGNPYRTAEKLATTREVGARGFVLAAHFDTSLPIDS